MITLAVEAVKRAGEILREGFGRASHAVRQKSERDYVTEFDERAEEALRDFLAAETPEYSFLLEESGALSKPDSAYEWVADPLDGTTNYIHRYPFFCVSLALRHKGEPVLGVTYDPIRQELFTAERGEGAKLNGVAISVSRTATLDQALLCTGFPFRENQHLDAYLRAFREIFLHCSDMRRDGSAALDLAYVAAGRYDGFWELGLKPWDTAAGSLLVTEAGGIVSDFHGGGGAVAGGDIIAATGAVHPAVLAVLRSTFAAGRPQPRLP